MDSRIERALARLRRAPGASAEQVARVEAEIGARLPRDYAELLTWSNGGEGLVGDGEEAYLSLWSTDQISALNRSYKVAEYWPGLLLFGSDGGGEAYGYDFRSEPPEIVAVPFVSTDPHDVRRCGRSMVEFIESLTG